MTHLPKIAFISSALPPEACGVGDFAALLAQHWPDSAAAQRVHLVSRGAVEASAADGLQDVREFGNQARLLLEHLEASEATVAVLHYAARAYHRYGMPFWLARTMTRWRRGSSRRRLLVYFHELWNEAVAVSSKRYPLQLANRRICGSLLAVSDAAFTNTEKHAAQLDALRTGTPVTWQPVSANIPTGTPAKPQRGQWLLFGLALSRHRTLDAFAPILGELDRMGLIERLNLVGARDPLLEPVEEDWLRGRLNHARVLRHGLVAPEEVSRLIAEAEFCLDGQAPESITKSGVFMAYASHGAQVVSRHADPSAPPPLCYLIHPDELKGTSRGPHAFADRRERLRGWYDAHASWKVTAPRVAAALSPRRRRLVIVTTNLPPAKCGIGDHTARLLEAAALRRPVTFILPERPGAADRIDPAGRNLVFVPRSRSALRRVLHDLGPCDLFVQYSGYGYHPRDYPRWLVKAICAWRRDRAGDLTVFFHELWDRPPFWKAQAPIEWLHRRLVAGLAAAADHVFTNTHGYVRELRSFVRGRVPTLLPVGSNILAPADADDARSPERRGVLALLGRPGTRARVLRSHGVQLAALVERGRFHQLLVIGDEDVESTTTSHYGLAVEWLGHLDAAGVSAALLRAEFGLTDEGLPGCTKSGVFAAYTAHGLGILTSDPGLSTKEPVASLTRADELLSSTPPDAEELRRRADRLRKWYSENADWPVASRVLGPILSGETIGTTPDPHCE